MKKSNFRSNLRSIILMILGSCICAVAINGILVPKHFLSGGLTGVTLLLNRFIPSVSISVLYFVLNIPLFVFGYRLVGRRFFALSLAGTIIYTFAIELVQIPIMVNDMMLSAILAGLINGIGAGMILRSSGSSGGTDIFSVILSSKFGFKLGSTFLAFNVIILVSSVVFFSLDEALFTLVYIFVSSKIIDRAIYGYSQRKAITIISEKWKAINATIVEEMQHSTTLMPATGGFSQQSIKMIYTVISKRELHQIKEIILQIDPKAFLVVNETTEVVGSTMGNQQMW